jgi:hypothetical protein
MSRKPPSIPNTFAATSLPIDVHDQLRWLARDLGTTVCALLRLGAMMVLEDCGDPLPPSVAHLRRVSFMGQVRQFAHEVDPEVVKLAFEDAEHAALKRLADERGLGIARVAYDLVRDGMRRSELSGPAGSPLN